MLLNKETQKFVRMSLSEDNAYKDITSRLVIPQDKNIKVVLISREPGIFCGMDLLRYTFSLLDKNIKFKKFVNEGCRFDKGAKIIQIEGNARAILAAERVAINIVSRLSGIATLTAEFVKLTEGTKAKIMDTRKTTPLLRYIERYAVRIGGGCNHRYSLSDAVLVKDNHLRAAGMMVKNKLDAVTASKIIRNMRKRTSLSIEIEVETLEEFKIFIPTAPDIIMLDNFSVAQIKKAVEYRDKYYPKIILEASGGINLKTVKPIAVTGIDRISLGALTHSTRAVDFSLELI
ncbi:MAG: carboxylating nicotinate-nucleotide diphosphorylase [Candidatus Omnitrophica bacterium]|nr:carboxylating nicotinate-nucleotide diphosphorylase [Candidatus Omnitrophota bacterium]MDD5080650.1 carboxylating nicotinate-nucleotide diphosphorylase [Candidatus Omnitrophota bacterium]MDD5441057.1 carboxylating nicotinate-nucleotide diphosphorylase [Candidatus Omnitrophota bacterium]